MIQTFNNDQIHSASLPVNYESPHTAEQVFQYLDGFLAAQDTFVDMLRDPSKRASLQMDHPHNFSALEQAVAEGRAEPWMTELKPAKYFHIFGSDQFGEQMCRQGAFSTFFYHRSNPFMSAGTIQKWLGGRLPNALTHLKATKGFKSFAEMQPDLSVELVGELESAAKGIVEKIRAMDKSLGHRNGELYSEALMKYQVEGRKDFEKVLVAYDALRTVYNEAKTLPRE